MSQFDRLTDTELHQLSERLYHAVMRLFDAASATFTQMTAMGTWTEDYTRLNATAGVLMAAGSEQDQLLREVTDLVRFRRDQAQAQARAAEILAGWSDEAGWLEDAIKNGLADD
jgi:hypothetical protein